MIELDFSDFVQWHIDRCEKCAAGIGSYWDCPAFQEDMDEVDARADYESLRQNEDDIYGL